jgi:hypothetical protein
MKSKKLKASSIIVFVVMVTTNCQSDIALSVVIIVITR